MPWSGPSFKAKHAHSLTSEEAAHAARIANAILARTGKEGLSIATGISRAKKLADGGSGDDPSQNVYNPMNQGMIQRYAAMPEEKLQELSSQLGGSPQSAIVQRVLAQKRMKGDQDSAAQNIKAPTAGTQPPTGYATGGMPTMSMSQADPPWTRQEWRGAQSGGGASGFLHGTTPGRADNIKTTAPGGAMVIPAEVVAHRGQGNSIAGAANIAALVKQGPYGAGMPSAVRPRGLPKAPPPFHETGGYVEKAMKWGGDVPLFRAGRVPGHGETRVDLSDGEFVILPQDVAKFGGGDHGKGVKWWERWIMREHMAHIASLKKYKGPVKAGEGE